jgi:hypothetical protein
MSAETSDESVSAVQIIRGTAPLPPDIEDRFFEAYGRHMNEQELRFFGLEQRKKQPPFPAYDEVAKAA